MESYIVQMLLEPHIDGSAAEVSFTQSRATVRADPAPEAFHLKVEHHH